MVDEPVGGKVGLSGTKEMGYRHRYEENQKMKKFRANE
jgi:hypothetical protein